MVADREIVGKTGIATRQEVFGRATNFIPCNGLLLAKCPIPIRGDASNNMARCAFAPTLLPRPSFRPDDPRQLTSAPD